MTNRFLVSVLIVSCSFSAIVRAQHTERGAALGGIGGALAGAAIGKNNGDTGAGALIGGAVGLITGAVVGNSMDEKARMQAYEQQRIYRYQQSVSSNDVIAMMRNGIGDDVIINHVRENGVQRKLEVNDVITLHRNGVSEPVITAMQNASVGGPVPVAVPAPVRYAPRPVIVEEHYYAPPPPAYYYRPYYGGYYHHPHHHHHHHPAPSSHVHWGISVGR